MIETEVTVGTGLRITASKDELVQALGVVARAVSTRTSVQILSGILLEPHAGEAEEAISDRPRGPEEAPAVPDAVAVGFGSWRASRSSHASRGPR